MSMNLYLEAILPAQTSLGPKQITESFELWQTPTIATRSILLGNAEPNIVYQRYKDWVMAVAPNKCGINRYADDDVFCTGPVIRVDEWDPATEHLKGLDEWLSSHSGWTIEWSEI